MIRSIKEEDDNNNIIYVDKEKEQFDFIHNYQDLNEYIKSKWVKGKMNYILVDEIQDIEMFERTVRSFCTEPDAEVIVTGSNAKMLSSDLSTLPCWQYRQDNLCHEHSKVHEVARTVDYGIDHHRIYQVHLRGVYPP